MNSTTYSLYIVAREAGTTRHDLPLWATTQENPLQLTDRVPSEITHVKVEGVPGAFQLLNVLTRISHQPEQFEQNQPDN